MGIEIFYGFETIQKILLPDIPADAFEALREKKDSEYCKMHRKVHWSIQMAISYRDTW